MKLARCCDRPSLQTKFPALTDELVAEFLDTVTGFSTFFTDVQRELPFGRDPKDEPYLTLRE
jgi:hypothetical protein